MPLWGHLSLHVLLTFFLLPSTVALVCDSPWCVFEAGQSWVMFAGLGLGSNSTLPHSARARSLGTHRSCQPFQQLRVLSLEHWISCLLRWDKMTGEERKEDPNCNGGFTGKEASKKKSQAMWHVPKLKDKSDQDKTIKWYSSVTVLICNFLRFSSVKDSLT